MTPSTTAVEVLVLAAGLRAAHTFDHPVNVPLDFNRAQALARRVVPEFAVIEHQKLGKVHHLVGREDEILVGPGARKVAGDLLWP